jgi:hypothetical protein
MTSLDRSMSVAQRTLDRASSYRKLAATDGPLDKFGLYDIIFAHLVLSPEQTTESKGWLRLFPAPAHSWLNSKLLLLSPR